MHFRYARHTNSLAPLIKFYTEVIGLAELGEFKDHNGYDGIFLGQKSADWHLEFTVSKEADNHHFDEDDMIVFYFNTDAEIKSVLQNAERNGTHPVAAKNPYWQVNGHTINDPDGCKVVLALKPAELRSDDPLTEAVRNTGISDWKTLTKYVQQLPYGRNANRSDLGLVLKERKGTCSSKHAFLKRIADLNGIENVRLMLCMYRMTALNTPKTANILNENGLKYIPEAHCYLKLNSHRIDLMCANSDIRNIENDMLLEMEIEPEQVADFKVDYHRDFLRQWIADPVLDMTFDQVWAIRERCIAALGE